MATYAIGDIQGCFDTLIALTRAFDFDPNTDQLWLAGDLVNRGPKNAEVLRWCIEHSTSVRTVLGNHDLHVLAAIEGLRRPKGRDTMQDILHASDRPEMAQFLWNQPLLLEDENFVMVHAGCPPRWDLTTLRARTAQIESAFRGPNRVARLEAILSGRGDLAQDLAALTRMRTVDSSGTPVYGFAGPLDGCPPGQQAWFDAPDRRVLRKTVVFGHWAALGLIIRPDIIALDSGCVWGNALSAVRLEDRTVFQVDAQD